MQEKKQIAQEVVALYHGAAAANAAREYFERTVQQRELPRENVPEIKQGDARRVTDVMVAGGLAESRRAAERLVAGKGVRINGILVEDPKAPWPASGPVTLSVGARKFLRVLPN
jgi:tyrosyl-tRNA synthetase